MKVKLLSTLFFFFSQFSFSQTIKGQIVFNNYAIPNVEVINANSKTLTVTDNNGNFSIAVKANDILVFVSKEHQLKKITITPATIGTKELVIELILKAEELEEVLITKIPSLKLGSDTKWEQGKLDQYAVEKAATATPVSGVYMGGIENGMNFMRIGRMIIGLFVKEKEKGKNSPPKIEFTALANSSCDQNFYIETLKLKPEEIALFLQFCDADPKSKIIAEPNNILNLMDFLFAKNTEFKTLSVIQQ
ncbi:MAG: hypothetical protein ACI9WT_000196 [Flavobacterium sp.]|jgi:hypothetical protein